MRHSWWKRTFSVQAFSNVASKASEWLSTRALQTVVVVVGAVCSPLEGRSGSRAARILSPGLWVVGSSPTSGSESVWPHKADRYPGLALPTEDPSGPFSFWVFVCACVCPWAPSVSRNC